MDGLFFQTTVLLRWIVYLGFLIDALGIGFAGWAVYSSIAGHSYPGWTSLAVLILLVGGFIIISTGVTGLYIGKIFDQVKQRPLYVVDERWPPEPGNRNRDRHDGAGKRRQSDRLR